MGEGAKVVWSPFTKNYFSDPYEHLEDCRKTYPIQRSGVLDNAWFFFEYSTVSMLLRNNNLLVSNLSAFFSEKEPIIFKAPGACPFLAKGTSKWPMYLNGDEHKLLRSAIGKAFKELNITEIIESALKRHFEIYAGRKTFDLVDFSSEFIFLIIKDFFNLSDYESLEQIKKYSNFLARSQDLYISKPVYNEINDFFLWGRKLFTKSKFKTHLEHYIREAGLIYDEDEIYSVMAVLVMASFETSKDNLTLSLFEIIKNKDLCEYVITCNPNQLNILIEELIRYSSPLQYTIRKTPSDMQIGTHYIPAESRLFLCLASANRDPQVFKHPEKIIVDRNPNEHLSFGFGSHFCLGAQIARQELRYCLKPMVQFLRDFKMQPQATIHWSKQIFMRTIESVLVETKEAG